MHRVVIVEDHAGVREGLHGLLELEDDVAVVGVAESVDEIPDVVRTTRPDVLLLDIHLGAANGLDAVHAIRCISPATRVVVMTASDDDADHRRAFEVGVDGVLRKQTAPETLTAGVRTACRIAPSSPSPDGARTDGLRGTARSIPEERLSALELEVVRLVGAGYRNKEVAAILGIGHLELVRLLTRILRVCGVPDRVGLVMYALNHHIISRAA